MHEWSKAPDSSSGLCKRRNIRAESVYRDCPITILDRVTCTDLLELAMLDFEIILGMDCSHKCYATIDCRNRVVSFKFPNELE